MHPEGGTGGRWVRGLVRGLRAGQGRLHGNVRREVIDSRLVGRYALATQGRNVMAKIMIIMTAVGFLGIGGRASYADDYDTCMHDAAQQKENCLRNASQNHASDATCTPYYNELVRSCQSYRQR